MMGTNPAHLIWHLMRYVLSPSSGERSRPPDKCADSAAQSVVTATCRTRWIVTGGSHGRNRLHAIGKTRGPPPALHFLSMHLRARLSVRWANAAREPRARAAGAITRPLDTAAETTENRRQRDEGAVVPSFRAVWGESEGWGDCNVARSGGHTATAPGSPIGVEQGRLNEAHGRCLRVSRPRCLGARRRSGGRVEPRPRAEASPRAPRRQPHSPRGGRAPR